MADESANLASEVARAAIDLSVSATTTGFTVSLKLDNTVLAGILGVGAPSLERSFLQFVEDFEAKKVEKRLEEEFTKIVFQQNLQVTIRNADEVDKKVKVIRRSHVWSNTKEVGDAKYTLALGVDLEAKICASFSLLFIH
ncbi:hypothetical protein ACROYT_G025765 [Oculina patagonica]